MANGCHLPIQWQIKGPNGQYNGKRHPFANALANQKNQYKSLYVPAYLIYLICQYNGKPKESLLFHHLPYDPLDLPLH
jgi:hypothetical protein